MCGIFGYARLTDATAEMASFLAFSMEERGTDSWGMTDGGHVEKYLGPITKRYYVPDWQRAIVHTRAASCGEKTVENSHPFAFPKVVDGRETGMVIGAHNGCISNHGELNRKYNRKFAVDSMHIFAHIAEGRDTSEIHGWGAMAWFEDDEISFCRFNMTDFHICKLKTGEIVWCSWLSPIQRAARLAGTEVEFEYEFKSEYRYSIVRGEEGKADVLYEVGRMPFGFRGYTGSSCSTSYSSSSSCGSHSAGYSSGTSRSTWCQLCFSHECDCEEWAKENGVSEEALNVARDQKWKNDKRTNSITSPSSNPPTAGGTETTPTGTGATGTPADPNDPPFQPEDDEGGSSGIVPGRVDHIGAHSRHRGVCINCKTTRVNRKRVLVCPNCFEKIMNDMAQKVRKYVNN